MLKLFDPNIQVISVNLGRTLFFDVLYSQRCLPNVESVLLKTSHACHGESQCFQLAFLEAERYGLLEDLPVDLFVSIASMQEMLPSVIDNYFKYMRSSSRSPCYFYCCNRLSKELPDGVLTEFMKYPWGNSDILLDELCPWYQRFPVSRPPFWQSFDGPIQHRLARIA